MPLRPLSELPDDSRLWIFGADAPLDAGAEERLLEAVDDFLEGWAAHGSPLTAGREWREGRFLLVAADESTAPPSGCSIDALVRTLRGLERELGVGLVGHAPVWYREGGGTAGSGGDGGDGPSTEGGRIRAVSRPEFGRRAKEGEVHEDTVVFDPTLTRLGEVRQGRFELPAGRSWHGRAFL